MRDFRNTIPLDSSCSGKARRMATDKAKSDIWQQHRYCRPYVRMRQYRSRGKLQSEKIASWKRESGAQKRSLPSLISLFSGPSNKGTRSHVSKQQDVSIPPILIANSKLRQRASTAESIIVDCYRSTRKLRDEAGQFDKRKAHVLPLRP
ncbi:hypothetical protein PUN28_012397 [Cardiocondyla obscurior]|uniref:Uncharacterized protein n=1 Tax=Cardiocondyla obscurior TaxID=286306 RepID=A0AAW2FCH2_9HYME